MGHYYPATSDERRRLLEALDLTEISDLYRRIPAEMQVDTLDIPESLSEFEAEQFIRRLAEKNTAHRTILRGAGAYWHYIPSIVDSVSTKEAFLTSYTPYQAEVSQGVLQATYEYQSMISDLTGMDVSNASLYDGASAAAEATVMCEDRKRDVHIISAGLHPHYVETIKTYAHGRAATVRVVPLKNSQTDWDAMAEEAAKYEGKVASVLIQQPNCYGQIEDASKGRVLADEAGSKYIMCVNPMSLALLETPGEAGADIACGEGQPLGIPLSYGGPYLGFLTCRDDMVRKMPGRVVGETKDLGGRRSFVLTLQTREQHIRREKATSNICTNQALCALRAGAYMAAMGPEGLRQAAILSMNRAHEFAEKLTALEGFKRVGNGPFFHEFVTTIPASSQEIIEHLGAQGILAGLPVNLKHTDRTDDSDEDGILWCVTEQVTRESIDEVVNILRDASFHVRQDVSAHLPAQRAGQAVSEEWEVQV